MVQEVSHGHVPGGERQGLGAFLLEPLITLILVFVGISVANGEWVPAGTTPLAIGFALTGSDARSQAVHRRSFYVLAAMPYNRFVSEAKTPEKGYLVDRTLVRAGIVR